MIQPQVEILSADEDESELLEVGRIVPVYESLGGNKLTTRWIRRIVYKLLGELEGHVPETLPRALIERMATLRAEKRRCGIFCIFLRRGRR